CRGPARCGSGAAPLRLSLRTCATWRRAGPCRRADDERIIVTCYPVRPLTRDAATIRRSEDRCVLMPGGRDEEGRFVTSPVTPGSPGAPLVGRVRERAELLAALDDAAGGRGRIVLLAGEPGIGKTRLCEEVEARARAR